MTTHRRLHFLATAAAFALAPAARAVIIQGSAGGNTTAPTGSLANSGWQWQGGFQLDIYNATPVAPEYYITAFHVGGPFNGMTLDGVTYQTQNFSDGDPWKQFGDLRLWRIVGEFPSYAPLYNAANDGLENSGGGKNLVVYGRGTDRGSAVTVGTLKGWQWGADNHVLRWGENKVTQFATVNTANDMIQFNFDPSTAGAAYSGPNEAIASDHDSSGGVFIQSTATGEWKLAAVNYGATGTYRTSPGGSNFNGAIFDNSGLFDSNGNALAPGTGFTYASRITPALSTFTPFLNLPPTWKNNTSDSWTTTGAWTTGTIPNAIDARADFRTVIGTNRTVTLNSTQTVGKISFDNVNRYTISGSGSITMDVSSGNATIQLASGSHTISTPITLNDSLNINVIPASSVLTLSNQITATNKTINKQGAGTAEVKNIRASAANITAGTLKVIAGSGSSGTSVVSSITTSGTGKLDITNHDVVVPHTGSSPVGTWNGSSYTGLSSLVSSGFNSGVWNGPGIVSSLGAASNALTGVAIGEASDVLGLSPGQSTVWSGQTVDDTTVLIKYSYTGDLDLNGVLDGDDYFRIDSNILQSGSIFGYHNGDLNLDGEINGDDYFWIDSNILAAQNNGPIMSGAGGGGLTGLAAVPEPTSIAGAAILAAMAARRRRVR